MKTKELQKGFECEGVEFKSKTGEHQGYICNECGIHTKKHRVLMTKDLTKGTILCMKCFEAKSK